MGCNIGYNGPHLARITPKPKSAPLNLMLFQRPWPRKFSRGCTAFHILIRTHPHPSMLPSLLRHLNIPTELSLHLTVSRLVLLPRQSRLVFRRDLSRHWEGGRETALPFSLELYLLFFRRFLFRTKDLEPYTRTLYL